ncbi:DUF2628 domain-containing protein [Xenorhabdus entomophaga]|uniref:DUF2628 domain-containing protein n=1 Tax=Xenorhabdus entomophaga TaxID=3136257 RepID=UPI0030F4A081
MDTSKYSEKWQERFEFFEKNGSPYCKESKEQYMQLTFMKRIKIGMNFFAFFFGIFYFLIIGLWRKGLTLLGMTFLAVAIIGVIESMMGVEFSDAIWRPLGLVFAALNGIVANYAYYLKEVKGEDGWNPFTGVFSKK